MWNQNLKLIKKDERVFENIRANVQKKIYIPDIKIPIDIGDVFEWKTPSGQVLKLLVTDFQLYNMGSTLDHYEIEYVKE